MNTTDTPAVMPLQPLLEKLDELINATKRPDLPLDIAVWDTAACASYFRVTPEHFSQRIAPRPDFPESFKLSQKKRLWKATEVINWLERHRQRKPGRKTL